MTRRRCEPSEMLTPPSTCVLYAGNRAATVRFAWPDLRTDKLLYKRPVVVKQSPSIGRAQLAGQDVESRRALGMLPSVLELIEEDLAVNRGDATQSF